MQADFQRWLALMERQQGGPAASPTVSSSGDGGTILAHRGPAGSPAAGSGDGGTILAQRGPASSPAAGSVDSRGGGAAHSGAPPPAVSPRAPAAELTTAAVPAADVPAAARAAAAAHLTGDARADADILAFYAARHRVLQGQGGQP